MKLQPICPMTRTEIKHEQGRPQTHDQIIENIGNIAKSIGTELYRTHPRQRSLEPPGAP